MRPYKVRLKKGAFFQQKQKIYLEFNFPGLTKLPIEPKLPILPPDDTTSIIQQ